MRNIYKKIFINIDHLFIFYLYNTNKTFISLADLKLFLISAFYIIKKNSYYNYHPHINNIFNLYSNNQWKPLHQMLRFSITKKLLIYKNNHYYIDKSFFKRHNLFKKIREANPFVVILNEFQPLVKLNKILNKIMPTPSASFLLKQTIEYEKTLFKQEYQSSSKNGRSAIQAGTPRWYENKQSSTVILMTHGYLASPMELHPLALKLKQNYSIYVLRLPSHGTHHLHLKNTQYKEWINAQKRLLIALKQNYKTVIALGFSTGATISLYNYFHTSHYIDGLILISPAIYLVDKKSNIVPAITLWNKISKQLRLKLQYNTIKNNPTYPETNYKYNHIQGVNQLRKLIKVTKKSFSTIHIPTLVIQDLNDPVIQVRSAKTIFKLIDNHHKQLVIFNSNEHIIVKGKQFLNTYTKINHFLNTLHLK